METNRVRRRLVQSTLFPHKESLVKETENLNGEEVKEDDEERCGSSKKRRESKRKADPKPKKTTTAASKKMQVAENGKEAAIELLDDCDSPVAGSRSTPRKPKRRDSSTPKKERMSSTPKRKMTNGARELCCGRIPFDLMVDEQPSQAIPDLRLEAKLTAEENSRIFAGREIHPFFRSRKGGKTSQDSMDSENNWSSFERKEKGITFNPIHVFENVEDDQTTLNWGQWVFSERSSVDCLECEVSPVYGGYVDSLNFDNFLGLSHFTRNSSCQNSNQRLIPEEEAALRLPARPEYSHPISPSSLADERVICSEYKDSAMLPKDDEDTVATSVELIFQGQLENMDIFSGSSSVGSLASELKDKLLQERIMSNNHTCHNQPENSLWTDKYKPQNAKQICGNGESVKIMSEWLQLWHKRGYLTGKSCSNEGKPDLQDIDHDYQQSASDSDSIDDEESLTNVLLVTGPVGSGKSAAVYACARDQRFQVIEINASDWRSGALIKQKFGEAVESHWLQSTVEKAPSSNSKSLSKFFTAVKSETNCSDDQVVELIDLSDKEDLLDTSECPKMPVFAEDKAANYQTKIKSLILFEDVDVSLYEDQGFITTIQQLAETAKRPMILTSNSDDPILPKNLDRSEISFSVPSVDELLGLVNMISAAENTEIHPSLIERFVDYCQGDIRKTIMLLQFWCQGQTLGRGRELCKTYRPVPFDLDSGHQILPKVIPWGYPSQLSALVAEEVVKSLLLMEETHCSIKELNDCRAENIHMQHFDYFEAKKEAMLKVHDSLQDEVEYTEIKAHSELPSCSGSPVTFGRKNSRRKVNAVLSSDSEDELAGDPVAVLSDGLLDINVEVTDMKGIPTSQFLSTEICYRPAEQLYHSEIEMLEDDHCQLLEKVDCSYIHDTCKSPDMSSVPESSFVPESLIIDDTDLYTTAVSFGHYVADGANFIIQDDDTMLLESGDGSQLNNSLHILHNDREILGNSCDASTAFVYQEEVGDSLLKCEADGPRGFQLLDECSRVDIMRRLKSLDNSCESEQVIDHVQETWNKLHAQREDLRTHVTEEEKNACHVLKLVHGMSNLISEADLLLKGCQTLVSDSVRPSTIPSENTLSYTYYDNQLEMSSIIGEHGMCAYAKEITSLGSMSKLDLASEMLTASASSFALGKLASRDKRKFDSPDTNTPKTSNVYNRKSDICHLDILQSVVPSKSYLAAKGGAFHEYLSTLCQISKFEASRLSVCQDKRRQRRVRAARHYLSSGSLAMSSEQISMLDQYNSYQKVPSLLKD